MADRDLKGKVLKLRYGLTTLISESGAGAVYLAWDEDDDKQVAIRVPHEDLLDDEEFLARFRDPGHVPTGIPNVPAVLEIDAEGDVPFAVIEYVEGKSLATRIEKAGGRLSSDEIMEWLEPVGEALAALHAQGGVHRTVSPRSILMSEEAGVRLADLAVPSALGPAATPPEALDPSVFVDPKAIATGFTASADQYSLAAVIATSLMGEGFLSRQARKGMDRALESRLPHDAAQAVFRALDPDPEARFASVEEFVAAFAAEGGDSPMAMPLGEGTATMHLDDVRDQVATLISDMDDEDTDTPLAEAIPIEEEDDDEEVPVATVEPEPEKETEPERIAIVVGDEGGGGGKRWLFPIIVLIVIAAGAGAFFAFSGKGGDAPEPPPIAKGDEPVDPKPDGEPDGKPDERPEDIPEEKPEIVPPFSARVEIDGGTADVLTGKETIDVSGRLVDGEGGYAEVAGLRVDPEADGTFRAGVDLREGRNEITVRAYDARGRSGDPVTKLVVRDSRVPSVSVASPRTDTLIDGKSVRVSGRLIDDHPGRVFVDGIEVKVDEDRKFSVEVPLEKEGKKRIEIRGVDAVGNESRPLPLTVIRDTLDPEISITEPTESFVTAGGRIEVKGTVEDANLSRLTVNGVAATVDRDGNWAATVTIDAEHPEIIVVAEDEVEHRATARRIVTVDAGKPGLSLTGPKDGLLTNEDTIQVTGRVRDDRPARVLVNGKPAALNTEDGTFAAEVPLAEGTTEVTVIAEDEVGNRSDPVTVRVTSDRTPPTCDVTSPEAETVEEKVTIAGTLSEDGCTVSVAGAAVAVKGRAFTAEVPLAIGETRIEIVVRDAAGNEHRSGISVTRVKPGPPKDLPRLTKAGAAARVNGVRPDSFPYGVSPGDRISGPATLVTPAGDTLVVKAGGTMEVKPVEAGVSTFFVVGGEVTGTITNRTALGVSLGWLVVPKGSKTTLKARTNGKADSSIDIVVGRGMLEYKSYSVVLKDAMSVRLYEEKAGDLMFTTPTGNAGEVVIVNRVMKGLEIVAQVPSSYRGRIEQLANGKKTRLTFDTRKLGGRMPKVYCVTNGKRGKAVYVLPKKKCIVDKVDDVGDIELKDI